MQQTNGFHEERWDALLVSVEDYQFKLARLWRAIDHHRARHDGVLAINDLEPLQWLTEARRCLQGWLQSHRAPDYIALKALSNMHHEAVVDMARSQLAASGLHDCGSRLAEIHADFRTAIDACLGEVDDSVDESRPIDEWASLDEPTQCVLLALAQAGQAMVQVDIATSSGVGRHKLTEILRDLRGRGLAKKISERKGHFLTPRGRAVVEAGREHKPRTKRALGAQ